MALEISYNGQVIATLSEGQTATIPCKGKKMLTNLVVSLVADGEEVRTLSTPQISLDGSILSMTATDQETATFVILVDGVEKTTVSAIRGGASGDF